MKVLMLDIDGVLNNDPYLMSDAIQPLAEFETIYDSKEVAYVHYMAQMLAPENVAVFKELLKQLPDIKIGIHSNWIIGNPMKDIKKAFKLAGIPVGQIYSSCPMKMSSYKCHHAAWYLKERRNLEKFVIVDDDEWEIMRVCDHTPFDKWYGPNGHYFKTDEKKGLTHDDIKAIIKLFN